MITELQPDKRLKSQHDVTQEFARESRVTGLWYLGLAVTGAIGYGVIRPKLYVDSDPAKTLSNLVDHATLAHVGVVLELAIVTTQAVTAVMFYRLLRRVNPVAAWATGVFGVVNAVLIALSAVFMAAAVQVSHDPLLAPGGDRAATVQLLFRLSSNAWSVGGLFFGLWLIPIGYVAWKANVLPRAVGWLLFIGGAGYIASALLENALVDPPTGLIGALPIPATIAEVVTVFYLIAKRTNAQSLSAVPRMERALDGAL